MVTMINMSVDHMSDGGDTDVATDLELGHLDHVLK
jgi:hypothetical protein